jgi:hypothetical protein
MYKMLDMLSTIFDSRTCADHEFRPSAGLDVKRVFGSLRVRRRTRLPADERLRRHDGAYL